MPTTTNYGWTTPADTDLVKDGASAIRTLGTAIDTTVFNNASAGIAKTIVDAKGDLIAATAADTVARLAVGTNDQVLIADSTTATGLKWGTPSAGGLTLLSTTTLSGSSTSITGISSSYTNLLVVVQEAYASADEVGIYLRFNTDTGSTYFRSYLRAYDTAVEGSHDANPGLIYLGFSTSTTTAKRKTNSLINIMNYTSAGSKYTNATTITGLNSTSNVSFWSQGNYTGSAISSIQFTLASGTWSGGTVLLYGAK